MAKRTSNSSVNSSIRQQTKSNEEGLTQLLAAQQASLGELTSIKQLLELSRDVKTGEGVSTVKVDSSRLQEKMLEIAKEQLKGSRRYWKTQEEFQQEWDKEAKDIAEMAKGMKTFKTFSEKMQDKKDTFKEKFGMANGGLKKTVLSALNVNGVFDKTLARDEFVQKQRALGDTKSSTKQLRSDFEGARKSAIAIQRNERKIQNLKDLTGADEDELRVHHAHLFEARQTHTEELSKYDRSARLFSPDKKNAAMAGLLPSRGMSNVVPTPAGASMGKTPTATAAEAVQGAELQEESKRSQEDELKYLKIIAENTGGVHKNAGDKKPETKPEGKGMFDGILDTIMGFLSSSLLLGFKSLFNPVSILKALGKVFAIGMIVGALFEGIMDGFDEFMKTGDIGKALIAGLAGIIDFLTFGLFDKEKIKQVIGDFSAWIGDHIVKPFVDFISGVKDSFMSLIENIGIPEIKFKIPVINKEVGIGPFYPFKKEGSNQPESKQPEAFPPTNANQVEQKSAENANAKEAAPVSNKTNVVNAPVTNNSNTTQVIRSPIRNQESSQSRYLNNRYA